MIEMLKLTRQHGHDRLRQATEKALTTGCTDPAAVRHLLYAGELKHVVCEAIDVGLLKRYERPLSVMHGSRLYTAEEYQRHRTAGGHSLLGTGGLGPQDAEGAVRNLASVGNGSAAEAIIFAPATHWRRMIS
jgi:hypothetical protein